MLFLIWEFKSALLGEREDEGAVIVGGRSIVHSKTIAEERRKKIIIALDISLHCDVEKTVCAWIQNVLGALVLLVSTACTSGLLTGTPENRPGPPAGDVKSNDRWPPAKNPAANVSWGVVG